MVTVKRNGEYLEYWDDGRMFYDTQIPYHSAVGRLVRHMSDKTWFTPGVKRETLEIIRATHMERAQ